MKQKYDPNDAVIHWAVLALKALYERGPLNDQELREALGLFPPHLSPYNEATYGKMTEYLVDSGKIHLDKINKRWTLG